ncbi:DNA topoisomerase I [Methanobrevibacter filiformis]|uniref:DNA topoisomerase 1 n=1 Tax=Methanobrevibacter filiformis TaxID=55758 RepID=A0A165ZEV9_9EURY|nr:DNA topoisomerase I [Methanobrevibacter filiformis]KZX10622.1 DNA topoisomerase 1 [Methanobrevibacter filiformis]
MHEVIICEKPKSSEKIAKAISSKAVKKKYNKKVVYWEIEENGKKTTVLSAVGHLYSLTPKNSKEKVFFDLDWVPLYETDKTKKYVKDYVFAMKKFGKGADKFIHACDYDIEGTLIGFNALKYACGNESLANVSRMKFSTLTKKDILDAYENMIELDNYQVDSGIARHILDFFFGVNISKYLMKSVRTAKNRFLKLSAGRVQTPSLTILVDREKEIKKFVPEPYWMIKAILEGDIVADHVKGKIFDQKIAEKIFEDCQGKDAVVSKVKITEKIRTPPVPFNLGGLQSEAYGVFGFSPKRTQMIAQSLYTEGYASYPRTSSQKLPESLEFKKIFKQLSNNEVFKKHIDKLPTKLKPNEGKKEDAAHPAIHPTGILPSKLSDEESKIYNLIVYRFISTFFDDSKLQTMRCDVKIADEGFLFKRKRVSHMGWLEHYPYRKIEEEEFPEVNKGDTLKSKKITSEKKKTKPPARYNEASLVKELEKRELGTKATRADIIAKLYDRKYIAGKKIEVNQLGVNIIETLREYCRDITSEELTRNFEKDLDKIMADKITKNKVIESAKSEVLSILKDIEKNESKIGEGLYDAYQESRIVGKCDCGGDLTIKYSPKNKSHFVGCSKYPDCNVTYSLPKKANVLKTKCETCGLPMISFGKPPQRACLDPKCGKQDVVNKAPEIVGKCPECGKNLLKRSGRYGFFVGCEGFPKCRFTCSVDELKDKIE